MPDKSDKSLSELEREALVFKIAKEAQAQFWDRLKRPLVPSIAIAALVFSIVGISFNNFITGQVETIASSNVKKFIEIEFNLQKSLAKSTYDNAVNELTKSNKAAADVNEKQKQLLNDLTNQRKKLRDEIVKIEEDLNTQVLDTGVTVSNLNIQLQDLEKQASALKSVEGINIENLAQKVIEIESLVGDSDTSIVRKVSAIEEEQHANIKRLDILDKGNIQLGVGAQQLAQSTCVALGPATWVFAVPRDCSKKEKSCAQICGELKEAQAGALKCFNSLHIYEDGPARGLDQIGYKMYKYNSCGGGCGPNYCCCASSKG